MNTTRLTHVFTLVFFTETSSKPKRFRRLGEVAVAFGVRTPSRCHGVLPLQRLPRDSENRTGRSDRSTGPLVFPLWQATGWEGSSFFFWFVFFLSGCFVVSVPSFAQLILKESQQETEAHLVVPLFEMLKPPDPPILKPTGQPSKGNKCHLMDIRVQMNV